MKGMNMGGMNMSGLSMGGGHASAASGGMSMSSGGHGTANILPSWLAVIWTLVFAAIFVIHLRHLFDTRGQRRLWHSGHVLMALGMAFMYAPASISPFDIAGSFWQLVFAGAALVIVAWMLTRALERRAINLLWLAMAVDLAAMVYMWSPSGYKPLVTWLLAAYFIGQSLLWISDQMRSVDDRSLTGAYSMTPQGALGATAAQPLICYRDLRASMSAMTFGMAYMLVAMQLLM
jgi:hypothetical protein